jgi:Tfp pilus assembly protein PilN
MKLQLNLSTSPRDNNRPFFAGSMLVGTLGLLAFALLFHAAYQSWRSNRELRGEISRAESDIRASRQKQTELELYFRTPQTVKVLDRATFLNSLIGQRSFPWTKIFMDLEKTLPPGVRVVNISPKLNNGRAQVEITIGAATDEGKIKFLEALEKSKVFSEIEVKGERHSDTAGALDRVVLELSAWYATI